MHKCQNFTLYKYQEKCKNVLFVCFFSYTYLHLYISWKVYKVECIWMSRIFYCILVNPRSIRLLALLGRISKRRIALGLPRMTNL